ncbi:1-acyl-sn-glycerol-3-phosphate acyltransferase epsilon-like [Tropilaelaps mercedesae]|uniref:1-acyl-sn-glycerol-3-phosphate acyltransferase epsilon-like n=1 Tax=Tropilaelaps mercedesae TaxID=418985 RepID=A0A1V9XY34_9ACAR|nr:1-acyl-sn-glycerol-3-phosphate acyltransferase epsilon-like [Tropilaelaps mercedesae]
MTAAAEVQAMMPAGAAAVTPSQAELRSEDKVDAGEQRLQTGSSDMEISDGEMPAEGTVPQAVKKMSLVTHEAPTSTEQSDAAGGRSPTSTSDQDSSVKTLSWTLSVTYVAFMLYVQFIVQAGLCSIVYLLTPVVSLLGGAAAWWNLIDTVYEIHERVAILMAIALKGTKLYFYGDFEKARNIQESCIVICNHQVEGDYFVMAAAMEKTGKLSQLRHVMKDSLIWIPYVGSFLVARGSFFINRSNLNWKSFDNNCRRLCEDNVPTCLMIYPEGTTWNNAVDEGRIFEKSRQVAIESGREPFRHLLFPRARGFQRLLSQFRGQIKAVYDLTLVYSSTRDSSGAKKPAPSLTGKYLCD